MIQYHCKTGGCSKTFKTVKAMLNHKKTSHREHFRYVCCVCSKEFGTFAFYRTHLRMDHSEADSVPLRMKNTDIVIDNKHLDILVCTKCGYRYKQTEDPVHDCKPVGLLYFCPCCTYSSRSKDEITEHISSEHPGQCYELRYKNQYVSLRLGPRLPGLQVDKSCTRCDQCDSQFETNTQLMQHIEEKHANYPFACGFCMASYGRKCTLNTHLKQHLKPQFKCDVCHKEFFQVFNLTKHMVIHSTERPHQCDVCGNRYCDDKALKKHMMLKHLDNYRASFPESSLGETETRCEDPSKLVCHICGKTFSMAKKMNRHMRTHDVKHMFKCAECGKTFGTKADFNRHKQTHAMLNASPKVTFGDSNDVPTKDKDMYKRLRRYEQGHPAGLPYSCTLCNKRFSTVKSINLHIRTVHMLDKDKSFTCNICNKGFPTKSSFRNHLRLHSNSRPYKCRICLKQFKQVGHVREHMLIHGEAMFRCRLCGRNFKNRGLLRAHVVLHSNTLPYKCPGEHCTMAFHSLYLLWEHFATCAESIEKETELKCGICEEVYNKETILLHYQGHENEAHFRCDMCGVTFKTYSLLYFHKDDMNHFTESELSNASETHFYSVNHNESICVKGISREELMSQYDYIEQEDELPVGFAVESSTDIYTEHINKAGDITENPSGELLGIAEQLTHMASGIQYREIIIHGSERIGDNEIDTNTMEDNELEIQTSSEGTSTQYKEIVNASHQGEDDNLESMILNEESQEIEIIDDSSSQLQNISYEYEKAGILSYDNHNVIDDNTKLDGNESTSSALYKMALKNDSLQDLRSIEKFELNEEALSKASNLDSTENECKTLLEEPTTKEMVNYSHPNLSEQVRFVDKSGNEIIILVINEQGEQIQAPNSEEILNTVVKNGDYSILQNTDFVPDMNEGNSTTQANKHIGNDMNAVNSEILKSSPERQIPIQKLNKREVRNLDKIRGTFDKNLDQSIVGHKAKVALTFYEEKSYEKPIKCSICPKVFGSVKARNFHEKTHLPNSQRKYQCEECGAGFHLPNKLTIHMRVHTKERPHKCDQCGKAYSQPGHLLTHMRTHLNYYPFQCCFCDMKFTTNSNLKCHVMKNHQETQCCQCSICDLYLKDEIDLKIHQLWHLSAEARCEFFSDRNGIEEIQVGEIIYEQVKGFKNVKDITKHHRKLKHYICETCGMNLTGEAQLKAHKAVHNITSGTDKSVLEKQHNSEDSIMCNICGSYVKKELMKKHLIRHECKFSRNYQCKICGKQFKTEYAFMRHFMSCNESEVDALLKYVNSEIKIEQTDS